MRSNFLWDIIAVIILVMFISAVYWARDPTLQCDYAKVQVRAIGLCMADVQCILTVDDYETAEFWLNRQDRYCENEDERETFDRGSPKDNTPTTS